MGQTYTHLRAAFVAMSPLVLFVVVFLAVAGGVYFGNHPGNWWYIPAGLGALLAALALWVAWHAVAAGLNALPEFFRNRRWHTWDSMDWAGVAIGMVWLSLLVVGWLLEW